MKRGAERPASEGGPYRALLGLGLGFPLGVGAEINFGLRFAGTESRVGLWLGACLPK
jgi:hypothetical protein